MDVGDAKIDTALVKRDLIRGIRECTERGLHHSVKWLAELNFALRDVKLTREENPLLSMPQDSMAPNSMPQNLIEENLLGPNLMSTNAMTPNAMNQNAMNSSVMTPNVMTPNLMTSNAMIVNAMNPSAMTPKVMNPNAMTPGAMNPNVMTPSPMNLNVLTPSAMNPNVMTPNTMPQSSMSSTSRHPTSLPTAPIPPTSMPVASMPMFYEGVDQELDTYLLAKSYFDLKEYDRCAHFTKDCSTPKGKFLYFYSRYLSIEKKKLDNMTDAECPPDPTKNSAMKELNQTIQVEYFDKSLDGYCLYLYGIILKRLDLNVLALDIFVEAVNAAPLNWGAWQELALLTPHSSVLNNLNLPDHWMKQFFLGHAYLEQLNNDKALQIFKNLHDQGFEKSSYIKAQTAIVYQNRREVDMAINTFHELLAEDPYRLDNLDTYSNLLYVKELKSELADLAHNAVNIDKYRVETCCVIGNYYSLRSEHAKAVLYFQRALKLNPNYLSAWTLMGHEFMEMKNTNAAIQSYRQAIEINRRDYRAWYGLGQTYEILKMHYYSIYYYKQAQELRPNDSRMVIALGETYEKLDKIKNALKCYYKACSVGDIEGTALIKLAKLYDKLDLVDNAAAAYTDYCLKEDDQPGSGFEDRIEFYNAFQYLANYHLKKGQLDDAYTYAYKCLEHDETKEQGKALLKTIAARRGEAGIEPVPMEESGTSVVNIENNTNISAMDMVFSPNI